MYILALGGVFKIDWVCRKDLSFPKAQHLTNSWNDNKSIKIGRDGQEIEPGKRKWTKMGTFFFVSKSILFEFRSGSGTVPFVRNGLCSGHDADFKKVQRICKAATCQARIRKTESHSCEPAVKCSASHRRSIYRKISVISSWFVLSSSTWTSTLDVTETPESRRWRLWLHVFILNEEVFSKIPTFRTEISSSCQE